MSVCDHCGAMWDEAHEHGECGVRLATREILANHMPRGVTSGTPCPICGVDGRWTWGLESEYMVCMDCGIPEPGRCIR